MNMKQNATPTITKGTEFVTVFGETYRVVRVMLKSGKATVVRLKSGLTSNWKISEVTENLKNTPVVRIVPASELGGPKNPGQRLDPAFHLKKA